MPTRFLKGALAAALTAAAVMTASAQSLIRDAEIETTLRNWTDPILEVAGLDPDDVGLYIINDPELNAFVANGQRIHLHTGLLIAADAPGQIKGVIAHETCHIACGHSISRSRAANVASRPALISIGLGVLAMAAGAGDAGAALIASSQQFAALNFFVHTRAEEATADAAAVSYLAQLGQSPRGIVDFFNKYRVQEVLSESRRYPYFRSHPLASDRIRTTRALAEDTGLMDVEPDPQTVREFELMQAKLIGFLEPLARVYQKYPRGDDSEPARYARAIASMQSSDMSAALTEIDSLLEEFPENPYYWELKGQALFEMGRAAESVEPHAKSLEYLPGHPLLLINYGRSLIARAEEGDLEAGEEALRDALIKEPDNSFAWNQLASALEKQGRRAEAELATAESAYHIGDYPRAHIFARRAIEDLEEGTSQARRANDIRNVTDPALPENQDYWRRRG
ncbi:M48 family metalloprotease [Henriciella sp.]|uniref:M48 family metalloprotease n=1 Tax=Henriciella sp. TaxID=1968823 RepID=UPI0017DA31D8|nr:M48 family metalloprotease [Henriciella sp.]HIG21521.1 peptidase M48 [Henriciella sp.]